MEPQRCVMEKHMIFATFLWVSRRARMDFRRLHTRAPYDMDAAASFLLKTMEAEGSSCFEREVSRDPKYARRLLLGTEAKKKPGRNTAVPVEDVLDGEGRTVVELPRCGGQAKTLRRGAKIKGAKGGSPSVGYRLGFNYLKAQR